MLTDFIETYHKATIVSTQTTYVNLAVEKVNFRINFIDKAEFQLKIGTLGALSYYAQHPLLIDHNEPRTRLYINSRPDNPEALFDDIKQCIARVSQNWRSLPLYLFRSNQSKATTLIQQNIERGGGILLDYAPISIVKEVVNTCERHGVATKFFEPFELNSVLTNEYFKILFIGSCYVVAKKFVVRAL